MLSHSTRKNCASQKDWSNSVLVHQRGGAFREIDRSPMTNKYMLRMRQAAGGRKMTGHEAVSCTVTAPNGTVHAVPVTLADGGGHFQATLHWMQVGVHKVCTAFLQNSCR